MPKNIIKNNKDNNRYFIFIVLLLIIISAFLYYPSLTKKRQSVNIKASGIDLNSIKEKINTFQKNNKNVVDFINKNNK